MNINIAFFLKILIFRNNNEIQLKFIINLTATLHHVMISYLLLNLEYISNFRKTQLTTEHSNLFLIKFVMTFLNTCIFLKGHIINLKEELLVSFTVY